MNNNEPNKWICCDFKARPVVRTSYSIVSPCLMSWVLEGSNDGSEGSWKVVDCCENNEDFSGLGLAPSFAIGASAHGNFRLRHRLGSDILCLSLEVFGTLSPINARLRLCTFSRKTLG